MSTTQSTGASSTSTQARPGSNRKKNPAAGPVAWLDDRAGLATLLKKQLRKVFPDHWSFMLGEIALWSFVVLLLTGVFLSFWFKPSMEEVEYAGSYAQLRGIHMSEAYASTLDLSFDVRGGLLMRQMHHWSANLFLAAMTIHMLRIFFTGAFRKPRELNWLVGLGLLQFSIVEGFAGYSLPDDLLSGTGLRIAEGLIRSIPVVGTYLSFFVFGGEFPGDDFISRLYIVHVLLIPGLLVGLISAHMLLLVYHKHTQWPGPGRTESNVVGYPLLPVYAAKAGGFFFTVFGVTALMGGLMQINPIWMYGPYDPSKVTADAQPDWYMGWLEGGLRIMPNWETHLWGFTVSWNVMIPGLLLMGLLFTVLGAYPFVEAWITGDKREHHILDRPRNHPTRTAFGAAGVAAYGVLWAAGGNDLIAPEFHISIYQITWFSRIAFFVLPVIVFIVARRWCLALQRHDRDLLLHGYETGVIVRSPDGGYSELHRPINPISAYNLTSHRQTTPLELPAGEDENGVAAPKQGKERVRARLSQFWYGDDVVKPTGQELEEAAHHHDHVDGDGHKGIETGGQVGGDEFELEESGHSPTH